MTSKVQVSTLYFHFFSIKTFIILVGCDSMEIAVKKFPAFLSYFSISK